MCRVVSAVMSMGLLFSEQWHTCIRDAHACRFTKAYAPEIYEQTLYDQLHICQFVLVALFLPNSRLFVV